MTRTFSVKNFERFQHYTDRTPPWIKLYNTTLDDYDFGRLQDASKLHLIGIWLLASRCGNKIPYDPEWISKRINATDPVDLGVLLDAGFIQLNQELQSGDNGAAQDASTPLAECLPREREEGERDSEAYASAQPPPLDAKSWVFGELLGWLGPHTGRSEEALRRWLGKCCSEFGDDAVMAAGAMARAPPVPVDPIAAMMDRLKAGGRNGRGSERFDSDAIRAPLARAAMARSVARGDAGAGANGTGTGRSGDG